MEEQDSLNPEGEQDTNPENESDENIEELEKTKEAYNNQKIRAEKAEKELKKLKQQMESNPPKKQEEPETSENKGQSNEPDYAKLAYLEGKGISHPDDQKIVQDEANRLKLPLTDILAMEHIQTKLKTIRTQREAEAGMPESAGKPSGSNKTSIDYWIDKKDKDGNYLTPDDLELAEKIISAREKQHKQKGKFSDVLYT